MGNFITAAFLFIVLILTLNKCERIQNKGISHFENNCMLTWEDFNPKVVYNGYSYVCLVKIEDKYVPAENVVINGK